MLWTKSWLETRWRFLIGLAMLMLSAASTVLLYPQVLRLLPMASTVDLGGEIGRRVAESVALAGTYRGYAWSKWFSQSLPQTWTFFAILLGTGGLLSQSSGGGTLFTLSMPATRNRLLDVRAATGLGELLLLAFVPSLLVPLLSPAVGQRFHLGDALLYSTCVFVAGSVFFSLAFLLSTVFSDIWRPLLIAGCLAMLLSGAEQLFRDHLPFGLFRVMSAESHFRGLGLPWLGLLTSAALSVALLGAARKNIARLDF